MTNRTTPHLDQREAPLLTALSRHVSRGPARWHTPGHKGHWIDAAYRDAVGAAAFAWDLTELTDLDNLHQPLGPIAEAEALAAALYGGDQAYFLVNGSSAGLQAVLQSLPGTAKVLLPRHAHRALVSGLVLSGGVPVWMEPDRVGPWSLPAGPGPDAVRAALAASRPDLVVLVHPTYHGYTADLAATIAACHEAGVPVLVDAAHGAHLRFHDELPADPIAAGADAAVYSFHKTLGAVTGAAVLVARGERLDLERLRAALTLLQTSSPSYLMMASLDGARREAARSARTRLAALLPALRQAQVDLRAVGIEVAAAAQLPTGYRHDPTKLLFSLAGHGLSGTAAAAALRDRGVELELAEAACALALVTPADTPEHIAALTGHIKAIVAAQSRQAAAGQAQTAVPATDRTDEAELPVAVMTPSEAYRRRWQTVPLAQAAGRVAAALVSVSPPGIANLVPGELIDANTIATLQHAIEAGLVVQGLQTAGSQWAVMVVAE